jgi:hypothetical protein
MNAYRFSLLRSFVSSLETTDADTQSTILEAMDVIEESDDVSDSGKPVVDAETSWDALHSSLKGLAGDGEADDMQVLLRNSAGDTYLFFKKGNKVEFVATASGEEEPEAGNLKSKFLGKGC